jgi:hypothetical protein
MKEYAVCSVNSDKYDYCCVHLVFILYIILPVVLHGCESWSLTFREKCRLRFLEKRVLRRIFGPRRGNVTGNGKD